VHTPNLHARDPEIRRSPVALGLALLDTAAGVGSSRWAFVSGILITGGGLSCIFVPRSMVAMASVKPQLAGAASGLLNITRQLGSVPGSAAVDALLRNRLAATQVIVHGFTSAVHPTLLLPVILLALAALASLAIRPLGPRGVSWP
jgi:hypothetical protein